ncbi:hypothetical protein Tco_0680418 [Tanacetum coccineum]|uniref:Uncharacterized protein n=1 Tax=Tanacetum coccineum TaxID=301880 RepID=A0ABQ4XKH4_9ASTR
MSSTRLSLLGDGGDEFILSSLEVLLILATFDGLDVGLFEDVIGENDCDDDDCDEKMSLVRMLVDDEFTLSSLEVLLILATFDGLDVGLLEDVIGEDDCDDDDCDEEMSLVRMLVDGC